MKHYIFLLTASIMLFGANLAHTQEISFSETTIDFGEKELGTGHIESLTISNASGAASNLQGSVSENSDDYSVSNSSFDIAPGSSHTVNITFQPVATGNRNAQLRVQHNAGNLGSPTFISLVGEGTGDPFIDIQFSDLFLDFGEVEVGQSEQRSVTITAASNNSENLTGSLSTNNADYTVNNGSFNIAPSGSQNVTVTFSPSTDGTLYAELSVAHNGTEDASPFPVQLYGTGAFPPDIVEIEVSPGSIEFGTIEQDESAEEDITVSAPATNTANLTGTLDLFHGAFSVNNTDFDIPPGGSHTATIKFESASVGEKNGTLQIHHNTGTEYVSISGEIIPDSDSLETVIYTLAMDFGVIDVGESGTQTLRISNKSTSTYNWTGSFSVNDAQYSLSNNSFDISPGGDHYVDVTFKPASNGQQDATLRIISNAPSSPLDVSLTGMGYIKTIDMSLNQTEIDFDDVTIGSTEEETLIISNDSGSTENLVGSVSENHQEFSVTNASFDIAPGESHSVIVAFSPTSEGAKSAALRINHNATNANSPLDIPLEGDGELPLIGIELDKTELDFGQHEMASGSYPQTLIITHVDPSGSAPAIEGQTVSNLQGTVSENSDYFEITDGAEFDIANGEEHTVWVRFYTTFEPEEISANLRIEHNATFESSPIDIPMTAEIVPPSINMSLDKSELNFGSVTLGDSKTETLTIAHDYLAQSVYRQTQADNPLALEGTISVNNPDFEITDGETFSIERNESHTVTVRFTPQSGGAKSGALIIEHDATNMNSPIEIPMQGVGTEGSIDMSLDKSELNFSEVPVGEFGKQIVTISNAHGSVANLTGEVSAESDVFSVTDGVFDIAPGSSHAVTITFIPNSLGEKSAPLEISHNATNMNTPTELPMQGRGTGIIISVDTSSIDFGQVFPGNSFTDTLVIYNAVNSIAVLTGMVSNESGDFEIAGQDTAFNISPGDSHEVSITFTPGSEGTKTDTLKILHNAHNLMSPVEIPLTGKGATNIIIMSVDTASIDFGKALVGEMKTDTLTIFNAPNSTENLTGDITESSGNFEVTNGTFNIAPGDGHNIAIRFIPGSVGDKSAILQVTHNATNYSALLEIALHGEGTTTVVTTIEMSLDTSLMDFGDLAFGETSIDSLTIYNAAASTENLVGTVLENSNDFEISDSNFDIFPGDSHKVAVVFTPGSVGSKKDTLWISHNAINISSPTGVAVQGQAVSVTGVADEMQTVASFQLHQNYPNPFNPETSISFSISETGIVTLKIYDTLGRLVRVLVNEEKVSGEHTAVWNGRNELGQQVASGLYFYQLIAGQTQFIRRMLLLK